MISQSQLKEMKQHITGGKMVAFCGAGVSAIGGVMPLAVDLAGELAKKLGKSATAYSDLVLAATAYEALRGRQQLIAFLVDRIDRQVPPLASHIAISKTGFCAIITTNWDNLLEAAFQQGNHVFAKVVSDIDVPFMSAGVVPIVKLHGSIERKESIVISDRDYYDLFSNRPNVANMLKYHLSTSSILFLGYGLGDPDFKRLYFDTLASLGKYQRRCYAVQRNASKETIAIWEKANMTVINHDLVDIVNRLNTP